MHNQLLLDNVVLSFCYLIHRKDVRGKPIAFDESEESDTALSQLQSSAHPQSLVSF